MVVGFDTGTEDFYQRVEEGVKPDTLSQLETKRREEKTKVDSWVDSKLNNTDVPMAEAV